MTLSQWCWTSTAALGLHILEEYTLNWKDWAYAATGIDIEGRLFFLGNGLGIVLGIITAELAPSSPTLALAFPALLLINAVFFHIGGFLRMRGRFSPGLITAVLLFLPLGVACYRTAWSSITAANVVESVVLGAGLMMAPIMLIKLRSVRYFQQPR
jgi:hypothetical protein